MTSRQSRKIEHMRQALALSDGPASAGFEDLHLVHNCLPEAKIGDVSIATNCAGMQLLHPVIINAMTGGAAALTQVNARLAEVAKNTGSVMAVGSQFAALKAADAMESYRVVRKVNPSGIIWANIGAYANVEDSIRVVDMIEADALQIHLNVAQELIMPEGDSDFTGWLHRIEQIARKVPVPVIVKETGCGMAMEQVRQLSLTGVKAVDVGGAGGTNFISIEASRTDLVLLDDLRGWGIPTAISAIEAATVLPPSISLIVSGGVRTPLDALKSLVLGATAVGLAVPVLRRTEQDGVDAATRWLQEFIKSMQKCILMLGRTSISDLSNHPLVITGRVAEWLEARGISVETFARRSKLKEGKPI